MTSLRARLAWPLLAGTCVAFIVAGAVLHANARSALTDQFDAGLRARSNALASLLERDEDSIEFDYTDAAMPEYAAGPEASFFALWWPDATEASRSPSLGEAEFPRRTGPDGAAEIWDMALPDGRPGRALGMAVTAYAKDVTLPEGTEPLRLTLVVAASRSGLDATLAGLTWVLVVTDALALGVLALLVTGGVRRGLRPVRGLAGEVARLDATSLARRVDSAALPDELVPLAEKLNELLARLESAFARERRMTAAVAHELRTPIAELRAATDIARRWPEDADVSEEAVATAGDVARRMGEAVDAVLRFCRLESGQEAPQCEPVPLRTLLDELWRPHERTAADRGLRLVNEVPAGAAADGDRGLLALALGNMLDNACSFAAPGPVRATCAARDGVLALRLTNAAAGLAAADLAHLSEPFWRKDAARSDGRHAGLGLSLVTSVTRVLGGRVEFTLDGGEFAVTLRLPAAVAPAATPAGVMPPSSSPARAR